MNDVPSYGRTVVPGGGDGAGGDRFTVGGPAPVPRRLHPRSIVARSWPVAVVGLIWAYQNAGDDDMPFAGRTFWLTAAAAIAGLLVVALAFQAVVWHVTWYALDDTAVHLREGLLFRQERHVRLDRLQAVDVVRPFVARLLGLSEVRVEVAGAGTSRIALRYLADADATALRNEVLARAAGVRADEQGAAPAAPEAPLYVVPNGLQVKAFLLDNAWLLVAAPVLLVLVFLGVLGVAAFGGAGALALALLQSLRKATSWWNTTLAESPDGLRLRRGLLDTRAQTVPPGRVHAVSVVQPLFWRPFGIARAHVTIAGYGAGGQDGTDTLLPVAPMPVVWWVVGRVFPGIEVANAPFYGVSPQAPRRAPIVSRRYGFALLPGAFASRSGVLRRTVAIVPDARVQSVRVVQGPWQRGLGLATVRVDVAPGPVTVEVRHLDAAVAARLADELSRRSRAARHVDRSERWMASRPVTGPSAGRGGSGSAEGGPRPGGLEPERVEADPDRLQQPGEPPESRGVE